MNTYIALLRGINVGGQKKVSMVELRECLEQAGLLNVKTYIQSGNVVFQSEEENPRKLEDRIRSTIIGHFGFDVPVLVKTISQFKHIFDACPFSENIKKESYFVLLFSVPSKDLMKIAEDVSYPNETFFITKTCVYLHCALGYGKAKLNNNFFERKLKTTATTRNYKTMVKLLALAQA